QSSEATFKQKSVDIIFIIDNSNSMSDDIIAVENNISTNFASIIGGSGIDYRVIVIGEHGSAVDTDAICIKSPLSTTTCNPIPPEPGQNPPIFYHYNIPIDSHNSLCQVLDTYDGKVPDLNGYAPNGWKEWLRTDALKIFVELTDDGVTCFGQGISYNDGDAIQGGSNVANKFDADLLAKDPTQFGDANKRNYIWHSIIGLKENSPATTPYLAAEPVLTEICGSSPAPGTAYQFLSKTTGGLRFPICQNASFDVVFKEIAKGVIEGSKVECEFAVPTPPEGQTLDLATVQVEYTPEAMGMPQIFKQVKQYSDCVDNAFYISNDVIKLCPTSCDAVQADMKAKIAVLYGCKPDVD
ncbi:MAG: hypothetical protein L6Q76_27215, partial [Polyangiaceae bacterium]|nr:hypothetical protein [Polyangiaceae bacterium]